MVREANDRWTAALEHRVVEAGCPPAAARRVVVLLDAAFMGLQLDLPLDRGNPDQRRAVLDLAEGLAALTGAGRPAEGFDRAGVRKRLFRCALREPSRS